MKQFNQLRMAMLVIKVVLLFTVSLSVFAQTPSPEIKTTKKESVESQARRALEALGQTPQTPAPEETHAHESGVKKDSAKNPDSSGMNEEDKDVMMANLERTKSDYSGHDGDELFEKISKAYLRNLGRILKRKDQN